MVHAMENLSLLAIWRGMTLEVRMPPKRVSCGGPSTRPARTRLAKASISTLYRGAESSSDRIALIDPCFGNYCPQATNQH